MRLLADDASAAAARARAPGRRRRPGLAHALTRATRLVLALAAGAAAPACYGPPFAECRIECGPNDRCPDGSHCNHADGYCHQDDASCLEPNSGWLELDLGLDHSCGLAAGGALLCWGDNNYGQSDPRGAQAPIPTPTRLAADTAFRRVSTGHEHTCAIRAEDDALLCWGGPPYSNRRGGDSDPRTGMATVQPGSRWLEVSAGAFHTCAIRRDGTVWCWGDNEWGELGVAGHQDGPALVAGTGESATAIAAGWGYTCAIRAPGALWCWGKLPGSAQDPPTATPPAPLRGADGPATWRSLSAGSRHVCGLRTGGILACWGETSNGQLGTGVPQDAIPIPVTLDGRWTQVSAGHTLTCGVREDGRAACWGENFLGGVGDGSPDDAFEPVPLDPALGTWRRIAVGGWHACALDADRARWCWGSNETGQQGNGSFARKTVPWPIENAGGPGTWTQVAPGGYHTCGVGESRLFCWGANLDGQLGLGDRESRPQPTAYDRDSGWTKVSAGLRHSCALKGDGTLWCWGLNNEGQVTGVASEDLLVPTQFQPGAERWADVAAGDSFTCGIRGLDPANTLVCWGGPFLVPEEIPGTWTRISARGQQVCGVDLERAKCWKPGITEPTAQDDKFWREISAGVDHGCGVRNDGSTNVTPHCWGDNSSGQLGTGGWIPREEAAPVTGLPLSAYWLRIVSGAYHSCAIGADSDVDPSGALFCWGHGWDGQIGSGQVANHDVPVKLPEDNGGGWVDVGAGWAHTCAVTAAGKLYCWGANGHGQLGDGTGSVHTPAPLGPPPGP